MDRGHQRLTRLLCRTKAKAKQLLSLRRLPLRLRRVLVVPPLVRQGGTVDRAVQVGVHIRSL